MLMDFYLLYKFLSENDQNIVFMIWGGNAQSVVNKLEKKIPNFHEKNHIIKCNHPSPLSANRGGWFNTKPFSRCNEYLKEDSEVNPCNFYGKSKFLVE